MLLTNSTSTDSDDKNEIIVNLLLKSIKAVIYFVSLIVLLFALLAEDRNVQTFYREIFFLSAPASIDYGYKILPILLQKEKFSPLQILCIIGCCLVVLCLMFSLGFLIKNDVSFIQAHLNGKYWGLCFFDYLSIFFAFTVNCIEEFAKRKG